MLKEDLIKNLGPFFLWNDIFPKIKKIYNLNLSKTCDNTLCFNVFFEAFLSLQECFLLLQNEGKQAIKLVGAYFELIVVFVKHSPQFSIRFYSTQISMSSHFYQFYDWYLLWKVYPLWFFWILRMLWKVEDLYPLFPAVNVSLSMSANTVIAFPNPHPTHIYFLISFLSKNIFHRTWGKAPVCLTNIIQTVCSINI